MTHLVQRQLEARFVKHLHLIRMLRQKPVNHDTLSLADAVATRLRLHIVLQVPVRVEQNNCIGCGQSDAQTTRTRGEQKAENV